MSDRVSTWYINHVLRKQGGGNLQAKDLVGTAIPSGAIRCNSCLKTHKARDGSHALIGVLPNFQFCIRAGKFATWTQLAIPRNFLSIPNLERD